MIFRVFFGPLGTPVTKRPGYAMTVPLLILAFLSVVGGYLKNPLLGFLHSALPRTIEAHAGGLTEIRSEAIAAVLFLIGALFCISVPPPEAELGGRPGREPRWARSARMVVCGLGLRLDVRQGFRAALHLGGADQQERFRRRVSIPVLRGWLNWSYRGLSRTETGRVRWYAAAMAAGSVLFIAMVLFL